MCVKYIKSRSNRFNVFRQDKHVLLLLSGGVKIETG